MRRVPIDQKGFSLVEILIGMSILAIGLLALAEMQITAIRGNAFSSRTTDATTLAQDRMEQLMALGYSDSDLTDGAHPPGSQATIQGTEQVQGINYTISWNVTDDSPMSDTKTVSVIVTWTENSQQRTVSIQSVKPRIN